jgi:phenylacetate-CoA ligase
VNVYPSEVEAVLLARPDVAPHYLLVVDRRTDTTGLIVACELDDPDAAGTLAAALRERLGIRATIAALAPGTVPRTEVGKARRRADWLPGQPAPLPGL